MWLFVTFVSLVWLEPPLSLASFFDSHWFQKLETTREGQQSFDCAWRAIAFKRKRCNPLSKGHGARMHFTENNIICRPILLRNPNKVYHVSGTRSSFRDMWATLKISWRQTGAQNTLDCILLTSVNCFIKFRSLLSPPCAKWRNVFERLRSEENRYYGNASWHFHCVAKSYCYNKWMNTFLEFQSSVG